MQGVYFKIDKVFVHHCELLAKWSSYKTSPEKTQSFSQLFVRNGNFRIFSILRGLGPRKSDRPLHHQLETRIEAHIFLASSPTA